MRKIAMLTMLSLFVTLVTSSNVFAQSAGSTNAPGRTNVESTGAEVKARGANPNIKGDRPTSDAANTNSRGSGSSTCWVYLHNYTAYSIDIYVDGYWEGTLGAYDDSYLSTGSGYTTMYGLSVGKTREWNFSGVSCYGSHDYYFY